MNSPADPSTHQSHENGQSPLPGKAEERFSRITILLFLAGIAAALSPMVTPFLVPIVLAATFAGLFYSTFIAITRRFWNNRIVGALLTCLILIVAVLIPVSLMVQLAVRQTVVLYTSAEPWVREFLETWRENPLLRPLLQSEIGRYLTEEVDWASLVDTLARNAAGIITTIINRTYAGVFGLALDLLIMLFVLFYFFVDGQRFLARLGYLIPMRPGYKRMILDRFLLISRATVKGTLIIGVLDGIAGAIALLVTGVPGWALWGVLIVFLSILPVVGAGTILVPAAIIQLVTGRIWQGIVIFLSYLIVVSNIDNVVRPRIVGTSARMHDLLVFFATLGGLSVFGIMGFIVGPVIASLFLTLLDIYGKEFEPQLTTLQATPSIDGRSSP